ncbi:MAG: DUF1194 domain-containing protein [Alphaproteobacteria bacterium]
MIRVGLAALAVLAAAPAAAKTPVDLLLALAVDVSRSVDEEEARLQRQGYIQAFRDPEVVAAIRTGMLGRIAVRYFEWGGEGNIAEITGWTLVEDATGAAAFADSLARLPPRPMLWTSISGAIDYALPWLKENEFDATRKVLDISGDGPNNSGDLVVPARDRAIAAGVTINGLPIMDQGSGMYTAYNIRNLDLYYRDCVIGGPGAFLIVAEDFNDFARAVRRKLILEIANRAPQPPAWPMRIVLAQAGPDIRESPPCNVGEQMLRYRDDF